MSQLARLAIEHPEFETNKLCANYDALDENDLERIKYENYCILVYNTLLQAYRYENSWRRGSKHGCEVKELILIHRKWLENEYTGKEGMKEQPFSLWLLKVEKES